MFWTGNTSCIKSLKDVNIYISHTYVVAGKTIEKLVSCINEIKPWVCKQQTNSSTTTKPNDACFVTVP